MAILVTGRKERENAKDYAYRILRDNIGNLSLAPGSSINDCEIAGLLGVSRTPVREAINQLQNESEIIEIYPQRGMKVSLIDANIIRNVRLLRKLIEMELIRECCEKAGREDLQWFSENIVLQEFYHRRRESSKVMEQDNAFHQKLYDITGYQYLYRSTRGQMIHYDRVRTLEAFYDTYEEAIHDHRGMYEAIRDKDGDRASQLMEIHLDRWLVNEKRLRREYPEYFKKEQ